MRSNIIKAITIASVVVAASACSTVASYKTDDAKASVSATQADKVAVYSTSNIGREYKMIGSVTVAADAGKNAAKSVELLKKEAAKLGADAIIDLRLAVAAGYWTNSIKSTGTAVIYRK